MSTEIEKLEEEIKYEQMQYDIACEHPTHTDQYYRALEKGRQKLMEMKQKLSELKKNL